MEENFKDNNQYENIDPTKHSLDILRAAIPYIDRRTQRTLNLAIQAAELSHTLRESRTQPELSALDLEPFEFNIEGLLVSIKEVCSKREREQIDFFLNIMSTKKLYDTYSLLTKGNDSMKNHYTGFPNLNAGFNNMDLLKTFLSPEQASTFETMSTLMSAMNMS